MNQVQTPMIDAGGSAAGTKAAAPLKVKAPHPIVDSARMFCRNYSAICGVIFLALILLIAFLGPVLCDADPFSIVSAPLTPPTLEEGLWMGTDYLGRDVLVGILYGGRATLAVGATAALLSIFIGISLGAYAGYYGGMIDEVLMRVTEFFQVLPALLFAMVFVTLFSPTLTTIALAIGAVSWPGVARLTRGEFLKLKQMEFVTAERAIGSKNQRIIWCVILPNALAPLIVSATMSVGVAILFSAGLDFLGLGDPNSMSWGLMIGASRDHILEAWWPVTFPGVAIFVTVLSVSLIGDGLNDALNPKLRER
ncbi:ABC transporter permease [Noviherbaspirillum soli]|uniref:ABC transporter permease n=1 Tax=Noviherbaspirillum soli TaxID=1064518 RepID=UPI00188BEFDC